MNNTVQAIETGAQTLHDKVQTKASSAIVYQDSVFLVVDDFEIMRKVTAAQLKRWVQNKSLLPITAWRHCVYCMRSMWI